MSLAALLLAACASVTTPVPAGSSGTPKSSAAPTRTVTLTIFGLNDFHGHLQAAGPVPWVFQQPDASDPTRRSSVPHGGYAHVRTALERLRAQRDPSLTVGVGDLIGASPLNSSLLKDEPTLQAMNDLGMTVSAVGNHEFDAGKDELLRKMAGQCPAAGCALPGFSGVRFDYVAANVLDESSGKPWLKPYVIRELQGVKVAFIGAVTRETPGIVMAAGIRGLRFADEADSINAQIT